MTTHRNWMRLVVAHAIVALGSPLLGLLVFLFLSFNPKESFHFGGSIALIFSVFFAYLLFGVLTVFTVLVASPLLLVISKIRNKVVAFCTAGFSGGLFGWLFCTLFVAPNGGDTYALAAKLAGALTGIVGAVVLELGWRTSWRAESRPKSRESQVDGIGTNPVN